MIDFDKLANRLRKKKASRMADAPMFDEPLKNAQTAIVQQPVNEELYALETLRRSLPFVTKIDIETDNSMSAVTDVIVYYNNGMTAKITCFRKPEKTEELVNIALAGAHQCLSDLSYGALFNFNGEDRRVWRKVGKTEDGKMPVVISTELEGDRPKLNGATPSGVPGLREVLLAIPGVACMPGEYSMSTGQVKKTKFESIFDPRVSMVERGRIKHDREEKPCLDKVTAKRAANAMAELMRSVGIDGTEEKTDEKR